MHSMNLTTESVKKLFMKYLLPSISATLVTSIYILADTIMIGKGIGDTAIAALNILLPIFSIFYGTGMLFGVGGGVLFSICKGSGDEEAAKKYFTMSILGAAVVCLFYLVVFNVFFDQITAFLGRNLSTDAYVRGYGRILTAGIPIFTFSSLMQAFVRNDKAPKLAMAAVISGGVTNVILDYIFIYILPFGMAGACAATLIGNSVTLCILLSHLFSKQSTLRFSWEFQPKFIGRIVVNGLTSFFLEMAAGIVIFLFNRQLLVWVGDSGVIVYSIISNSALIVTSISNGIAQALQPIAATNYGAGHILRVENVKKLALTTALISGVFFFILGFLFPQALTHLFIVPTEEILTMAIPAIRIYFLSFILTGFNIVFGTYFQSVLMPHESLCICLLRGILLNSLLVFVLPLLFGVNGIWMTMTVTEVLTFIVCLILSARHKTKLHTAKTAA